MKSVKQIKYLNMSDFQYSREVFKKNGSLQKCYICSKFTLTIYFVILSIVNFIGCGKGSSKHINDCYQKDKRHQYFLSFCGTQFSFLLFAIILRIFRTN